MKRKAKRRTRFQPVFLLSQVQRNALWIALDTLAFVNPSINLGSCGIIADGITAKLSKLDDYVAQAEIELSYDQVIASAKALEMAIAYLNGNSADFLTANLMVSRLPQELREYGPVIRSLQPLFKEFLDAFSENM